MSHPQRFTHDQVDLFYADEGTGRPIVLVHGFPLDRTMWDDQIAVLKQTYRTLAPDLRGFGDSAVGEAEIHNGMPMEGYADDLTAMLDHAGIREQVVLAGFSMGGYIAWQFALQRPERLRALVLSDTRAVADSNEAAANREAMAKRALIDDNSSAAEAMLPKLLAPETLDEQRPAFARTRAMIHGASPGGIAAAQRGMATRPDVRSRLREITCPALVVVGAHDAISAPAEMRELAELLPNATFVAIPDAGHMAPVENPEAYNAALVEFLAKLP